MNDDVMYEAEEVASHPEPSLQETLTIGSAQVQDAHVSRKANGATYITVFEVPLAVLEDVALAGDGHTVYFQEKEVGRGADIRRIGITKDADNNLHVKLAFQFAQTEIAKSLARLGKAIAFDANGTLVIEPAHIQQTFDLTSRAE